MGYFHTENTCQELKILHRPCHGNKKKKKKNTEMKKLTSKHLNDSILHKYTSTEKVSSWYP